MTGGLRNDPHDPHRRFYDDGRTASPSFGDTAGTFADTRGTFAERTQTYNTCPWPVVYITASNYDSNVYCYPSDGDDDKARRRRWAAWIGPKPKFSALLFERPRVRREKFSHPPVHNRCPVRLRTLKRPLPSSRRSRRMAKQIPAAPRARIYRTHYRHEGAHSLSW